MFKEIEIWILYLTILLSILFAIGFGLLVRQELVGATKAGWVSKTALTLVEIPVNLKKVFRIDLKVEDRFPAIDGFDGTPNSEESYLLLSRYDGDLEEGVVELVDLRNFKVLHTWNPDIDEFNDLVEQVDEFKFLERDANNNRFILKNPVITRKGELIFNSYSSPLRNIDACSNLIFQNTHDRFHHSIEMDIDGNIWVPSSIYPQSLPPEKVGRDVGDDGGYFDDAIIKLTPDGEILYEKSLSQIFIDNGLEHLLFAYGSVFEADPIHLNDIQPVNFDGKFWKKGDVFISLAHQSMVILFRPSTEKILWKYQKNIFYQHDVNIINEEEISIFNNNKKHFYLNRNFIDGHNEVLIYNFEAQQVSSYLQKSLAREDVRTPSQGRGEILPNGDLFVEETDYARTLYFNSDGSLRWTHVNRADNGSVYIVGWSRVLYTQEDIQIVNKLLETKETCNEKINLN